jgi:uncharacterized membrane protein
VRGEGLILTYNSSGELRFLRDAEQVAATAPEVGRTFVFDCDGEMSFKVRFGPGEMALWAPEALGGQRYVDCRSNPSKVPWADAARRGVTFRALGNEPSWYVEEFPDRAAIVTDLGTNRTELAHGGAVVEGTRTTYRAAAGGREATVVIDRRACADSMSGEGFEAAATVSFESRTLRGCGRFL